MAIRTNRLYGKATLKGSSYVLRFGVRRVLETSTARKNRVWAKRLANYCCRECGRKRDDSRLKYRCRKCQNRANRYQAKFSASRAKK